MQSERDLIAECVGAEITAEWLSRHDVGSVHHRWSQVFLLALRRAGPRKGPLVMRNTAAAFLSAREADK